MAHTQQKYAHYLRHTFAVIVLRHLFDQLQLHVIYYLVTHLKAVVIGLDTPGACCLQF